MEQKFPTATDSPFKKEHHESYLQFDAKLARIGFLVMDEVTRTWRWHDLGWNGRREDEGGQLNGGRPKWGFEVKIMKFL